MIKILLFMCPHNAAKSVLAVAYAQQQILDMNIQGVEVISAGTQPDDEIAPAVAEYLSAKGFDLSGQTPRLVTENDLSSAYKIISMGCDLNIYQDHQAKLLDWGDVPPPSQGVKQADQIICQKIDELLSTL